MKTIDRERNEKRRQKKNIYFWPKEFGLLNTNMVFIHATVIFDEKIWMLHSINNHKNTFYDDNSELKARNRSFRLSLCMCCLCRNAIANSDGICSYVCYAGSMTKRIEYWIPSSRKNVEICKWWNIVQFVNSLSNSIRHIECIRISIQ